MPKAVHGLPLGMAAVAGWDEPISAGQYAVVDGWARSTRAAVARETPRSVGTAIERFMSAIVERRFDEATWPDEREPVVALAGFDSPVPRRIGAVRQPRRLHVHDVRTSVSDVRTHHKRGMGLSPPPKSRKSRSSARNRCPHLGARRGRWHGASRCQAAPRTAHAFAEITNGGSGSLSLQSSRSAVRLSRSRPAT
jgi:hypothetical protein